MELSQELGIGELQFSQSVVEVDPATNHNYALRQQQQGGPVGVNQQNSVRFSNKAGYFNQSTYSNASVSASGTSGGKNTSKTSTTSTTTVSTNSSDNDEDDDEVDLNDADIKLAQLRRGAVKRRGKGKAFNRLEGLQSYEQMMKGHTLKRMEDGLRHILSLHTPVELSSICGALQLKAQQKANVSIEQIIRYSLETEDFSPDTLTKILSFMWEGALWEYLHSIGHPVRNIRIDPKTTILEIWEKGGFLGGDGSKFAPHFITRETKRRNEWVTSPDIQQRLEQLIIAQDQAKLAEKKIISDHDYTNILSYFKHMSKLRMLESSVREYLISELEITRSRIDSSQDTVKMLREQLGESELYLERVSAILNHDLSAAEIICAKNIKTKVELEENIYRLNHILDSYLETEQDRSTPGGGGVQALKPRQMDIMHPLLKETFSKMRKYRDQRDENDDLLRLRARCHVQEIEELREKVRQLEQDLADTRERNTEVNNDWDKLRYDYVMLDRKLARTEQDAKVKQDILWRQVMNNSNKAVRAERKLNRIKPLLKAGMAHSSPFIVDLCWTLLNYTEIVKPGQPEHNEIQEQMKMKGQDNIAYYLREQERMANRPNTSATMKSGKSKGKSGKGSSSKGGSSKKKSGKGGDDDKSISSKTSKASKAGPSKASSSGKAAAAPSPSKKASSSKKK